MVVYGTIVTTAVLKKQVHDACHRSSKYFGQQEEVSNTVLIIQYNSIIL